MSLLESSVFNPTKRTSGQVADDAVGASEMSTPTFLTAIPDTDEAATVDWIELKIVLELGAT
jgi:hypothetical protein